MKIHYAEKVPIRCEKKYQVVKTYFELFSSDSWSVCFCHCNLFIFFIYETELLKRKSYSWDFGPFYIGETSTVTSCLIFCTKRPLSNFPFGEDSIDNGYKHLAEISPFQVYPFPLNQPYLYPRNVCFIRDRIYWLLAATVVSWQSLSYQSNHCCIIANNLLAPHQPLAHGNRLIYFRQKRKRSNNSCPVPTVTLLRTVQRQQFMLRCRTH